MSLPHLDVPGEVFAEASRFRDDFFDCLTARGDELFELADALLCADGPVTAPVDLTLVAEHRRGYGAMYDALNNGNVDVPRLRQVLAGLPMPHAADGRLVLAVDITHWLRPDAVTLGAELRERSIGLHVVEQGIDTATMEGRAMFGMLSVLAELQRELIVANTNDGLASARARGRVGGRRPKLTEDQAALAQRLYDEREKTVQQIADMFSVPRSTVYGHLDRAKTVPRQPKKTKVTKS